MQNLIERVRGKLEVMPASISGSMGSTAIFEVACVLVKGYSLPDADAWQLITEWNGLNSQPLWSEAALRRKLSEAAKSGRPDGYLLNGLDRALSRRTPRRTTTTPAADDDAVTAARHRQSWPTFRPLTDSEIIKIANLRHVALSAVHSFSGLGFMPAATVEGHECFVIHEGAFAQARRFDGGTMTTAGGPAKTKTLMGSRGAFIGHSWLGGPDHKVLMVEGCIGLLEALAGLLACNPPALWTLVAATSAGSRFSRDPELLAALSGRFVRILADPNEAGLVGAASWLADLEGEGCTVEVLTPPDDPGDWGEVFSKQHEHKQILQAIFK